jgi:hypothetical protein
MMLSINRNAPQAAWWDASVCAQCGHDLQPQDPVWFQRVCVRGQGGVVYRVDGWARLPVCYGCAFVPDETVRTVEWELANKRYEGITGRWLPPRPCHHCGRPVVFEWNGRLPTYVACSERCRRSIYTANQKAARAARREKRCGTCGGAFTATRAHSKTCSPACRQRLYRRQRSARKLTTPRVSTETESPEGRDLCAGA